MSGYPLPDPVGPLSGNQPYPPYSAGNNPSPYSPSNQTPYPANILPESSNLSYPSQTSYPSPNMNSNNSGYLGTGDYPTSPGYPNSGKNYPAPNGYPTPGGYPTSTSGGYPTPRNVPGPGDISTPRMNPNVCPTAPDLGQMEKILGYEQLTFDEAIIMPPSVPVWQPDTQERTQLDNLPTLTEEEVHDAAIQYVSEHCCYGSGVAKNMVITGISMMSAFHYKLETFSEKRESAWHFEPYNGQPIDGPMNGSAPPPWDVLVSPPEYFKDSKMKMEVPHTAFVKPCHTCVGNSRVRCEHCHGNGRKQCTWCKGRGMRSNFDNDRCTSCEGTGFNRCTWCHGSGQTKCKTCNGKGQLKGYVELIITWTNHVDDYISETSSLPKELVRSVTGQTAFEEENPRVRPIMHSSDQAVNNASNEYINKHNTAFPNERVSKQRQCLRLIPIGEVNYAWKENAGQFYVYGYEHKVYFKSYPQKCCCCTIL